jgi:hypothetical protein
MIKRILAGAAAAGFAASLFAAAPASAACSGAGAQPTWTAGDKIAGPAGPSNTTVYGAQSGNGGYLGVTGSTGWLKAEGGAPGGGTIKGSGGGVIDGKLTIGTSPHLCVNGQGA